MTRLDGARILVTGGAGFIGSHLVDALLRKDVGKVVILDNMATGRAENVAEALADGRVQLAQEDGRNRKVVEALFADGVDVVFHLACLGVRHSLHDPRENHEVNASMTLELLESAMDAAVSRFIHVSSSEVYGSAQYAPMDEGHPTFPETVYGAAKLAGEAYARAAYRTHGFPVTVARPFNAYGRRSHFEGDSGEVLPRTIVRVLAGQPPIIYGDGAQTRDFTHVTDSARGIMALAEADDSIGETVNIGSGREISIIDLARIVAEVGGRPDLVPIHLDARPGDVRRLLADSSRMRALTNFEPMVDFAEGVRDLYSAMRDDDMAAEAMLAQVADRNWQSAGVRA